MGILHTHSRRGPHGGPKITRDTPKIASICFVCLLMLVYNPPTKISSCRAVFCYTLPHLSLGWAYRTTYGHWGSQSGPQMTRDTPKVTAFWFDSLLALACDPPIRISLCTAVFCSFLPHLGLGWAYCIHMALDAPTVAPKWPEIPLRLLHFALSAFWCLCASLSYTYLYVEWSFALFFLISVLDGYIVHPRQ